MNDDAPIGIEDQVVLDAQEREIAAELAAMIYSRCARRQDFDHDDQIDEKSRIIG